MASFWTISFLFLTILISACSYGGSSPATSKKKPIMRSFVLKLQELVELNRKQVELEEAAEKDQLNFGALLSSIANRVEDIKERMYGYSNAAPLPLGCKLPGKPWSQNLISTVMAGLRIRSYDRQVRNKDRVMYRCRQPDRMIRIGSENRKCINGKYDEAVEPYCVSLWGESEWRAGIHQLETLKTNKQCEVVGNSTELLGEEIEILMGDPFECNKYHICSSIRGIQKKSCGGDPTSWPIEYFKSEIEGCKALPEEIGSESPGGVKVPKRVPKCIKNNPTIEVKPSANWTWDPLGWLLITEGSDLAIDCVYPRYITNYVTEAANKETRWYKDSFSSLVTGYPHTWTPLQGKWISDYRYRLIITNITEESTGIYRCEGAVKGENEVYVTIRDNICYHPPLPSYEIHNDYYELYPFMSDVEKICNTPDSIIYL